ncbi:MAG: SNF2-related protein [Patescibacteria group bacterium]|nr:SNF2-related protein [Patescibacteria group bacterium]
MSCLLDFNKKNIPLRDYQIKAIEIANIHSRYAFYFDTGVGKTRTACAIIKKDFEEHFGERFWIVITPKTVIPSWIKELELWDLPYYIISSDYLKGSIGKKFLKGEKKQKYLDRWQQETRKILLINPELLIRNEITQCDCIVVDESSIMQYPDSKQTLKILGLSFKADKIYLLSGSPAPNDPIYLWAQARVLQAYNQKWRTWAASFGVQDRYFRWHSRQSLVSQIFGIMQPYCWYLSKKEVLNLAEPTVVIKDFYSSTNCEAALEDLASKDKKELKNTLIKLRTLASGFAYINENEDSEITEEKIEYSKNTEVYDTDRLDTLLELIESYGNKKLVIWYQFIYSYQKIKEMLDKKGIKFTEVPEEFVENPDIQIFLSHPRSCGKGVDGMQKVCSDMIFYELSFSYDEYYQSLSRLHRFGQENPVIINILVNKSSIDEWIIKAIEKKANFLDYLIDNLS